jgi:DNA-binding transcriptional MerR regulator
MMNRFSISQLQQFSGVKAHTIRIWESRYNALTPIRSKGNTRYYDNLQLRRLLNITSLMNSGYKVSELCSMSDEELFAILQRRLESDKPVDELHGYYVSQLIIAGMSYDEAHFEKIYSTMILRFGIVNSYINVLYPLLVRMGLMWANDTMLPSQEHFISNLIRQKLFSAIDSLPPSKENEETWLLYLPENEFHELGLLFAHYLLRKAGKNVIYLGSNVPLFTLNQAVEKIKPTHMLLFLVHNDDPETTQEYFSGLAGKFSKVQICISGNLQLVEQIELPFNFKLLRTTEDLLGIL